VSIIRGLRDDKGVQHYFALNPGNPLPDILCRVPKARDSRSQSQEPREQRRLLELVTGAASWKDRNGNLSPVRRQYSSPLPRHVRQPEIPLTELIRQLFVVEPQQVQSRGVGTWMYLAI
jgi:hypothetical protein